MQPVVIAVASADAMRRLAAELASSIAWRADLITLKGPLGAGKTTFTQGFIKEIGNISRVRSPSYSLLETYESPAGQVVHADLYRIFDPAEIEHIGLLDLVSASAVTLVEWPERAGAALGAVSLAIEIDYSDIGRTVRLQGNSAMQQSLTSIAQVTGLT